MAGKLGLYQKAEGGVWYTRRGIPADVKDRLLTERYRGKTHFVASTGEHHLGRATNKAAELWAAWGREVEQVRALGDKNLLTAANVSHAIQTWRLAQCTAAAGMKEFRDLAAGGALPFAAVVEAKEIIEFAYSAGVGFDGTRGLDETYFERHPNASRSLDMDGATALFLGQLQRAAREGGTWADIPGFQDDFLDVLELVGLDGGVPEAVADAAFKEFAQATLEVVQHEEAERRRGAWALAAKSGPAGIMVDPAEPKTPQVREGDKTVGEVIDAYATKRPGDDTAKAFSHIFKALKECLGEHRPIRSVTRADITDVRNLLRTVPVHASKLYPGVSLAEAAELGAAAGKPVLSWNTVRSYVVNCSAIFNYAKEGLRCIDDNPVTGLIGPKRNSVKRRGFTAAELTCVFDHLAPQREADSAHFWVPALSIWSGARANELCQLRVADVKTADGVAYLDLTEFDSAGRRTTDKRLKNAASERAVPLHPELIAAGFLEFVQRRRDAGEARLFPELTANSLGYFSHEVSRIFGRTLDAVGLTEAALCLHSARHGFRDAGRQAGLSTEVLNSLGGWSLTKDGGVGASYGDAKSAAAVGANAAHLAKITLGGFKLRAAPGVREAAE